MNAFKKISLFFKVYRVSRKIAGSLVDLPRIKEVQDCLGPFQADKIGLTESNTLDLGCGTQPRNPFKANTMFGIDIREDLARNIKYADLTIEPIPLADNHFDYVTAFDFLEHIPRVIYTPNHQFPFILLMNEIWRVLKPKGYFLSHTPIYPYTEVFRDPTHINIFTHETFPFYFDDAIKAATMYGFTGSFKIVGQYIKEPHLISILQKSA
jgi:SAM-dependent methyltransferase